MPVQQEINSSTKNKVMWNFWKLPYGRIRILVVIMKIERLLLNFKKRYISLSSVSPLCLMLKWHVKLVMEKVAARELHTKGERGHEPPPRAHPGSTWGRLTWVCPRVSSTGRRGTVHRRWPGEGGPGTEHSAGSAWENFPPAFWKDLQVLGRKEDTFQSQGYGKTHRDQEGNLVQSQ